MCVHMCVYACACMQRIYIHIRICVHTFVFTCVNVRLYVCATLVNVGVYVRMSVCLCALPACRCLRMREAEQCGTTRRAFDTCVSCLCLCSTCLSHTFFFQSTMHRWKRSSDPSFAEGDSLSASWHILCGLSTGVSVAVLTNPVWVIKTRLQVQEVGAAGNYTGAMDVRACDRQRFSIRRTPLLLTSVFSCPSLMLLLVRVLDTGFSTAVADRRLPWLVPWPWSGARGYLARSITGLPVNSFLFSPAHTHTHTLSLSHSLTLTLTLNRSHTWTRTHGVPT
jgi:Mitochondrial carrier protein